MTIVQRGIVAKYYRVQFDIWLNRMSQNQEVRQRPCAPARSTVGLLHHVRKGLHEIGALNVCQERLRFSEMNLYKQTYSTNKKTRFKFHLELPIEYITLPVNGTVRVSNLAIAILLGCKPRRVTSQKHCVS